jgi:hypothetical protein
VILFMGPSECLAGAGDAARRQESAIGITDNMIKFSGAQEFDQISPEARAART